MTLALIILGSIALAAFGAWAESKELEGWPTWTSAGSLFFEEEDVE